MLTSKAEKVRRKGVLNELKDKERKQAQAKLPISEDELKALFDRVDEKLRMSGCNHTLFNTLVFIKERSLDEQAVVAWLESYGGYCDCEVIANAENEWGEVIGKVRDLDSGGKI